MRTVHRLMSRKESVLVLGDLRPSLTVLRSLERSGYRTILGLEDPRSFLRRSHACHETWVHPKMAGAHPTFVEALNGFLSRRRDVRWIFPVGETQLRFFVGCGTRLGAAHVVMADPHSVATCLDKPSLYLRAVHCGVPCAPYRLATDPETLERALSTLDYPVVVRPTSSLGRIDGRRAVILRGPQDRTGGLERFPAGGPLLVQKYVDGERFNCQFLANDGAVLAYFEQKVVRTDLPDGTGYSVEEITHEPTAELREHTERLLSHLRYSGIGCVQYIVSRDDITLLEINPRLDASCAIPFHCGYDFPALAMEYARYRRGERAAPPLCRWGYPAGRRGLWVCGDVDALGAAWGRVPKRTLTAWTARALWAAVRADCHLVWSWADPMPALYALGQLCVAPLRALAARGERGGPSSGPSSGFRKV